MYNIPVLYINLEKRKDRKTHIENEFKDFENVERIEAVDTSDTSGYFGCVRSHIKALERAKEKDYDEVIICEDDFQWINRDKFIYPLPEVVEFDVCMVSGKINNKEVIDCNYNRVLDGRHTDCYIIKKHFYDTLLNEFKTSHKKLEKELIRDNYIDVHWVQLQKKSKFITPSVKIGRQLEGYSDIRKKNMKRY